MVKKQEEIWEEFYEAIDYYDTELCKKLIPTLTLRGLTWHPSYNNRRPLRHAEKQCMWEVHDLIKERINKLEDEIWEELKIADDTYHKNPLENRNFTERNHKDGDNLYKIIFDKMANTNQTPLHLAIKKNETGNIRICKYLIEHMPITEINSLDKDGETVLHICARNNQLEICKLLIPHTKSTINCKNGYGEVTPLHIAVENGYEQMVRLLVRNMSREGIVATNFKKDSAYSIAVLNEVRHKKIVQMLELSKHGLIV
jgi:hypothetical protein